MIARVIGYCVGRAVNEVETQRLLARDENKRGRRAFRRGASSAVAWLPLLLGLMQLPSLRAGESGAIWLAVTAASGLVFAVFLYRFGDGRGIVAGLWVWLLSIGILGGMAALTVGFLVTLGQLADGSAAGWCWGLALWIGGGAIYVFCIKHIDFVDAGT
jgi:hypothetical protein